MERENYNPNGAFRPRPGGRLAFAQAEAPSRKQPTALLDRILLFVLLSVIPLEDQIPTVGGRSVMWLLFSLIFAYIMVFRFRHFAAIVTHRFFLACYLFLLIGLAIEAFHPEPDLIVIVRLGQMIFGALLIATLTRDVPALKAAVWGYFAAALWLSTWLFLNDYQRLRHLEATTFEMANQIRATAFEERSLAGNLNSMAFFCAQGALAGLILTLSARSFVSRFLLAAAGLFCLVGSFLPLSRSGALCALGAAAAVFWMERSLNLRYFILILFLAGGVYFFAPQVSLMRARNLSLQTHYESGKLEGRARLYEATLRNIPEFIWMGVGCGNFYTQWGLNHGFAYNESDTLGTHNSFFEITVYWGLFGLGTLSLVVWLAFRCVPFGVGASPWPAFLFGLFVCLILRMLSSHNLYAKEFSLGFGILAGSGYWIWPQFARLIGTGPETDVSFAGRFYAPPEPAVAAPPAFGSEKADA